MRRILLAAGVVLTLAACSSGGGSKPGDRVQCNPDCRFYVWDGDGYVQDPTGDYGRSGPHDDGPEARPFSPTVRSVSAD